MNLFNNYKVKLEERKNRERQKQQKKYIDKRNI